jgi:putative aldouronate transport system substrate-binding protein
MESRFVKAVALGLALGAMIVVQAMASGSTESVGAAPKATVSLRTIYPGDEPAGMGVVLAELNKKLAAELGVELKLLWAPWDQYSNKIELAVAAGEQIDYIWMGSSDMATLTAKKLIAPIDAQLEKYGPQLYRTVDKALFDTMKIDGKIMGFPAGGNSPKRDVFQVILYREDLRLKHKLPAITTVQTLETFLKGIKANEPGMVPMACKSAAYRVMKGFGGGGFLGGTNGAVGVDIRDAKAVQAFAIQELPAFRDAAQKVREWYVAGYQHKDILNIGDEQSLLRAGAVAAIGGSAMTAAENQGTISQMLPGAVLAEAIVEIPGATKYLAGDANGGNALYVSSVSKHADEVVKFWGWVISSQENYDLYCYGIRGTHYELSGNRIKYLNTDYSTFPSWMFKNLTYLRFPEGVTDSYIQTIKDWDKGAVRSPLTGFVFSPTEVKAEVTAFSAVWGQYADAINSGALDLAANFPEIVSRFKAAGQETIVKDAQRQINAFLAM